MPASASAPTLFVVDDDELDDEPPLRTLGQLVLTRSGYEVDTAADGVEAWAALHDQPAWNLPGRRVSRE
jgi:CheY-like chemotaxis protein